MSKLNVLHAEIKAQRLANLAIKDELDETRTERDEARAEVERLKAAQAWQPIATVPKGVGVLCLIGAEGVIESAIIGDDDRPDLWGATHWVLVGELGRAPKGLTP